MKLNKSPTLLAAALYEPGLITCLASSHYRLECLAPALSRLATEDFENRQTLALYISIDSRLFCAMGCREELPLISYLETDLAKTQTRLLRDSFAASRHRGFVALAPVGPFLQLLPTEQLLQLAAELVARRDCTVALYVAKDSVDDSDLEVLVAASDTVVNVDESNYGELESDVNACGAFCLTTERRLRSGKVPVERVQLLYNNTGSRPSAKLLVLPKKPEDEVKQAIPSEATDPQASMGLASFRLGMTPEESEERAGIDLPHHRSGAAATTTASAGIARINYSPQPEDDWDDEDPDDDLGI